MTASTARATGHWRLLLPLIATNGVTVSALYWAQSVVVRASAEFGHSPAIKLMPGATLAGYAIGVALLAGVARDLTSPRGLGMHAAFLAAGLCIAASASTATLATLAFLFVGLGCSLTQRLLACATSAVSPAQRAQTIGWIIAAGLCGIILARALIPLASSWLGWRAMFWSAAALVFCCGLAATGAAKSIEPWTPTLSIPTLPGPALAGIARAPAPNLTAMTLWRCQIELRRAALQQALVFAAFNMAWAIYPRLLMTTSTEPALSMGVVASLGAGAAIMAGRVCGRRDPNQVAIIGLGTVAAASVTFLAVGHVTGASAEMALLDIGTQVALVANQARAQSLAQTPAMRGRLAAIVTTVGFAGGAIGAAVGNLIA